MTFQTVINLAGEIEKPHKNIFVEYGFHSQLLQLFMCYLNTFIGAVEPSMLAKAGWHGVDFASPFADIAILLGLTWLSVFFLWMPLFHHLVQG